MGTEKWARWFRIEKKVVQYTIFYIEIEKNANESLAI